MAENQVGPGGLLDTTDSLEAVGVFRGWKNFMFIIVLLCLLLLQGAFWLVKSNCIKIEQSAGRLSAEAKAEGPALAAGKKVEDPNEPALAAGEKVKDPNKAAAVAGPNKPAEPVPAAVVEPNKADKAAAQAEAPKRQGLKFPPFDITFKRLARVIGFANAILILSAGLYCLTALFCLKVSLVGRLGGISHISRAFFLSLIMFVLLLPWQKIFTDPLVLGAIYTPCELAERVRAAAEADNIFCKVLFYLRFSGYWLLILLLLILSQIRTCRWTKAILRRLEVI